MIALYSFLAVDQDSNSNLTTNNKTNGFIKQIINRINEIIYFANERLLSFLDSLQYDIRVENDLVKKLKAVRRIF